MVQVDWPDIIRNVFSREVAFSLSVAILVLGLVVAYLVWRWTHRMLERIGVPAMAEGTPFERTARALGTSTAGIIAQLSALFVYVGMAIIALQLAELLDVQLFWSRLTGYLLQLFIAALVVIIGLIGGDKAKLVVSDRLRSVKLPEADLIPELVKYSIFYIAALVALAQIGVATQALLVLLGSYAFGLVLLSGLAFKDLLAAGAAGIYLLLSQPYSIGDEVRIGEFRGIVQEVDVFVTHVESDAEEYIIPNQTVFKEGVVRVRK